MEAENHAVGSANGPGGAPSEAVRGLIREMEGLVIEGERIRRMSAEEAREKLLDFASRAREGFEGLRGIFEERSRDPTLLPSEQVAFGWLAALASEGASSMERIEERAGRVEGAPALRGLLTLAFGVGEVLLGAIGLLLGVDEALGLLTSGLEFLVGLSVC